MENEIYTLGIWNVKQGCEKDFISEWSLFAEWSIENIGGGGKARLLQDESNPQRFISFGPWKDKETVERWRNTDEFKAFREKVKPLLESFQPNTLQVVATTN
jgi:quinol monooxygenase YgiN